MIKKIKVQLSKIDKWEILGFIFNISIFFVGFGIGGMYLIVNGFDELNYISIVIGILFASVGFGHTLNVYFNNIKWLNFILYIPAIIIGLLSLTTIVGLAIIPFLSGIDLKIDLGILLLKDGFVRFGLIILDIVLAYKLFNYLKQRIYKHKRMKVIAEEVNSKNKQ